jgi:hypothetical protein
VDRRCPAPKTGTRSFTARARCRAHECGGGTFPDAFLHPYGIRAVHPDTFVEHLLDLKSEAVCGATRRIRRRLANPPPCTAEEMISNYERHGLAVSASILRTRASSF